MKIFNSLTDDEKIANKAGRNMSILIKYVQLHLSNLILFQTHSDSFSLLPKLVNVQIINVYLLYASTKFALVNLIILICLSKL
jgi:hypothetical protein